ncbi:hypothetical protein [Ohessyouella blattaphilus]|uniref:Uncharacterized protein n=1 Tax=Ohessyouella blattaphilus TaxID=2949333 RepID=A0ABT1EG71_9FIRM|nr:hypothetical protein [Ohessyouella blattaphilus]MCP1109506.1 hypothetical protein [Ohessyouella blattaphilus]MCR8562900.1 hypothetical protein [Ohessyouella blattaphilus]MDL2250107.1 hypothetical protein [Lachnospiraceae bacterium OttesenSCG-928-J05]
MRKIIVSVCMILMLILTSCKEDKSTDTEVLKPQNDAAEVEGAITTFPINDSLEFQYRLQDDWIELDSFRDEDSGYYNISYGKEGDLGSDTITLSYTRLPGMVTIAQAQDWIDGKVLYYQQSADEVTSEKNGDLDGKPIYLITMIDAVSVKREYWVINDDEVFIVDEQSVAGGEDEASGDTQEQTKLIL